MMRPYIVFSFFLVTVCAASLGQKVEVNVSAAPTATNTTETNLKSVEQPAANHTSVSELPNNYVIGANETITTTKLKKAGVEDSTNALDIGAKTLEAFTQVLSSDELQDSNGKLHKNKTKTTGDSSKTDGVSTDKPLDAKHVHTRETDELIGLGSGLLHNVGLIGINNGIGNDGGIVRSDRLITTGGLVNNGDILRTDNFAINGRLLPSHNVVYNQGGGLLNAGQLVSSGQLLNSGRNFQTDGVQIYNSGRIIGSDRIGSGRIIHSGPILGSVIQGVNNNGVLLNNYQGGNGQIIPNSVGGNNQIVFGLDELNSVPQTVEYTKQFFSFEAPEEHQESGQITQELSNVLKKNLQVIFINAPENTATTNAALQLAKQAIEQKTVIYVLSKEADAAQLVGHLEQIQENLQTKPEVRIIKYRTAEDLERAKFEIQRQYEATGGSSESYNGGIVPVLNYASAEEAQRGINTLLGPGIVTSTLLGGHNADSSNVVSVIGNSPHIIEGQNIAAGKEALLASSVGQLNIIKSSNIGSTGLVGGGALLNSVSPTVYNTNSGLSSGSVQTGTLIGSRTGPSGSIDSNVLHGSTILSPVQFEIGPPVGSSAGSTKFFGTVPLISSSNSLGNKGFTREFGSSTTVTPISKFPVTTSRNIVLGSGSLIDSYNVGKNDGFGSSSLQTSLNGLSRGSLVGSSSGISNVVVSGTQPDYSIGSPKLAGAGSSVGGGIKDVSGFSNNFQSGSQTGLNVGSSKVVLGGSLTSGSSLDSGNISSFGTGSSNVIGSGSLPGSSNTAGSGLLLGSNSGNNNLGSISSFGSGSLKDAGTKPLGGSGVGSYASQLTIDSSKLSGTASRSSNGSGNIAFGSGPNFVSGSANTIDGVSVLSSTNIENGLNGSKGSSSGNLGSNSDYISGLGIGTSIGELVRKDKYYGSTTEGTIAIK